MCSYRGYGNIQMVCCDMHLPEEVIHLIKTSQKQIQYDSNIKNRPWAKIIDWVKSIYLLNERGIFTELNRFKAPGLGVARAYFDFDLLNITGQENLLSSN